jgi:hypothetical protein
MNEEFDGPLGLMGELDSLIVSDCEKDLRPELRLMTGM